jgi:RND family efflux transporter MFP subunit
MKSSFLSPFRLISFLKTRKKLSLFLILCIGAWVFSYFYFFKWSDNTEFDVQSEQIIDVVKQDLVSSLSVLGKSKIKNEQSLNFNTPGKVTWVYVELGQQVEKGTLLAEINADEVQSEIKQNQISLENAILKYENLQKNFSIEKEKLQNDIETKKREKEKKQADILLLEEEQKLLKQNQNISVLNTELEFQKSQTELANTLKALERLPDEKSLEREELKNTLAQQKREYDTEYALLDTTLQKQINSYDINLQNEYYTVVNRFRSIDTLLKNYNELLRSRTDIEVKNKDLKEYFSAKNSSYKGAALKYYQETWEKHTELQDILDTKTTLENTEVFLDVLTRQVSLWESLYELSKNISLWVDNSLFSLGVAEETEFQTFQSQANANMIESTSQIVELQKKQDEVRLLTNPKDENEKKISQLEGKRNQIQKLEYSLLKAEEEFQNISGTNSFEVQKLKLALETKQNELKLKEIESQKLAENQIYELKNTESAIVDLATTLKESERKFDEYDSPNNEEFALAASSVRQAEIALENTRKNLEKYQLKAPFSGIVSQVGIFVGDNLIDQDKTKSISLQNPFIVEVQVQVDQVDLVKISRGQNTQVFFDAYVEKTFSGSVIDVSGTPNTDSWVSKYEVKILVDTQGKDEKIYSGMSARVEILLKKLSQVIAIPSFSVENNPESWENFVTIVKEDGKREKKIVELGFSDGVNTEVISWLIEGQKIVELNFAANPLPEDSFGNPYGGQGF